MISQYSYSGKYNGFHAVRTTMVDLRTATVEELENGKNELFLDFRKNSQGELKLKLRNLIKSDKKIAERVKNEEKKFPNVAYIFIDTVSRQEFWRKYKKTARFLEKFHHKKNKKLRAYEFTKLHSIRPYTFPNLFASNYGLDRKHIKKSFLNRIESYFKKNGYITGFSSDSCFMAEDNVRCKKIETKNKN